MGTQLNDTMVYGKHGSLINDRHYSPRIRYFKSTYSIKMSTDIIARRNAAHRDISLDLSRYFYRKHLSHGLKIAILA